MIRVLFFTDKLGGGAEVVLRNLVDRMDQSKFHITVQTVWPYEEGRHLEQGIEYKSVYRRKTKFTEKLFRAEAAAGLVYPLHIKDDYDIECAYLEAAPTKIIASSTNRKAKKLAWEHCDLLKAVSDTAAFAEKTAPWYAAFDHVVCVSETVKNSFDTIFSNQFDSIVLYNVVDDYAIMF